MSIFSLGLLKGASERVSSTFDYMQETDREKATLAEQRQYEARTRKEEREYEEGRQRVANRFALTQFDAQTQAQKDLAELQSSLRQEENDAQLWNEIFLQNLQEDAARIAEEQKEKRLDTRAQEFTKQIQKAPPGSTIVIPQQLTTVTKEGSSDDGLMGLSNLDKRGPYLPNAVAIAPFAMLGPTGNLITDEETIVKIPMIDPGELENENEANAAITTVLQYAEAYIPGWVEAAKQGDDRGIRALENYMLKFVTPERLRRALASPGSAGKTTGRIAVTNPVDLFGIKKKLTTPEAQEWFTTFIGEFLNFTDKNIQQALGRKPEFELELTLNENGKLVWNIPAENAYDWAYDAGGVAGISVAERLQPRKLNDKIRTDAIEMARSAKLKNPNRIFEVVGAFKGSNEEKRRQFTAIKNLQTRAKNEITFDADDGTMIISPKFKEDLKKFTSSLPTSATQELLRIILPTTEQPQVEAFVLEDGRIAKPDLEDYYRGKYGLSLEDVGRKLETASFGLRTIQEIKTLLNETPAEPGASGNITLVVGGLKNILNAGLRYIDRMTDQGVNFRGFDPESYVSNLETAIIEAESGTLNQETGTRLLFQLGEQLAFAVAGMMQGGAKGNNISNADVEAQRRAQSIKDAFASKKSAAATTLYYEKFFRNQYDTLSRYRRQEKMKTNSKPPERTICSSEESLTAWRLYSTMVGIS